MRRAVRRSASPALRDRIPKLVQIIALTPPPRATKVRFHEADELHNGDTAVTLVSRTEQAQPLRRAIFNGHGSNVLVLSGDSAFSLDSTCESRFSCRCGSDVLAERPVQTARG